MTLFTRATEKTKKELINMMRICFNEPFDSVNFFFENKVDFNNCFTCINNDKITSVLHALPSQIKLENKVFTASYIYGACTLPSYRNRGYMRKLLNYYELQQKLKNVDFSILVPENEKLENYYNKLGYQNFFRIKEINFRKENFLKILTDNKKYNPKNEIYENSNFYNSFSVLEKLRHSIYNKINSVMYNASEIEYAVKLYRYFNGKFITVPNGYAICTPIDLKTVIIKDFTCSEKETPLLLKKIYENFNSYSDFKIITNTENQFFKNMGQIKFFGMIKPLKPQLRELLKKVEKNNNYPYLGIALD